MSQNPTFLLTSRIYQKWKDWDRGGFIIRAHATLTLSLCLYCKHKRQLDNIFLIVSPKHQSLSQQPSPLVCLLGKRKKQLVVWVCQFQHIMEILQYFLFYLLNIPLLSRGSKWSNGKEEESSRYCEQIGCGLDVMKISTLSVPGWETL